jgi:hypothetical protein
MGFAYAAGIRIPDGQEPVADAITGAEYARLD